MLLAQIFAVKKEKFAPMYLGDMAIRFGLANRYPVFQEIICKLCLRRPKLRKELNIHFSFANEIGQPY